MASGIPSPFGAIFPATTGRMVGSPIGAVGAARLSTDPLFYASLTLDNIIVGSRYRVTQRSNGAALATGVASTTSEVISGIPCYGNPMQVDITVRNASGSTKYRVFDTSAFMVKAGASAYILQQLD